MLKACKHSNCAVCKQIKERDIFKQILEKVYPEIYICEHAMYQITNSEGAKFIIPSLDCICDGKQGYYVIDVYTGRYIYIKDNNFELLCSKQGDCNCEPYVKEFNRP